MDMTNRQNTTYVADNTHPHAPRTYNFLLRLSRRLGSTAASSSFLVDLGSLKGRPDSSSNTTDVAALAAPHLGHIAANGGGELQDLGNNRNEKLKSIVSKSHEILMSANTVFPITLFPDSVTVDRTKVTITKRDFFWTSDVMSIRIEDVLNVSASVGPIFGSLTIASRVMSTIDHFKINHFWRNDAIRLKHIIQGYVIAQHNNIDTAHLTRAELVETLRELGHDSAR